MRTTMLVGLLLPMLGACALGGRTGPVPAAAPVSALAARKSPWKTLQLHAHSEYGGGSKSVAQLIRLAAAEGVDALVVSDHNDWRQTQDPGFGSTSNVTVIKGQEWGIVRRESPGGHAGKEGPHAGIIDASGDGYIPTSTKVGPMLDAATARSATIVVNHPKIPKHTWPEATPDRRVHAVEVWNSWFRLIPGVFEDPDGDWSEEPRSFLDHNQQAVTWWDGLLRQGRKLTAVGGSDFHRWPQPFSQPINVVYAPTNSKDELLASVRSGNVAIAVSPDGPRALLAGAAADGTFSVPMGGSIHQASGRFQVTVQRAAGQIVTAYAKRGKIWEQTVKGSSWTGEFTHAPAAGERDFVRVELRPTADSADLSAMTNPVYFE
jgi:hypothetical protein